MSFERELKGQLEAALNEIGLTMMSEQRACRLLAFVYVLGGAYEPVVLHQQLHDDLLLAAKRLNIAGGEVPDLTSLPLLQQTIRDVDEQGWRVPWLADLLADYHLKPSPGQLADRSPAEYRRHQAATREAHLTNRKTP